MIVAETDAVSLVMDVSTTQRYSPAWDRVIFSTSRELPCAGAGFPLGSHQCTPLPLGTSWRALLLGLTTGGRGAMGRESHASTVCVNTVTY